MKKLLFGCLGLIVVLILAAVIGIMSLPSTVVVERSRTVNATPEEVYAVVSDLHTWPDWTFWSKEADPDCTWDFQGETGDGASMAWEGPIHGKGKLTLKNCVPGQQVEYDMVFIEESMASVGSMALAADMGYEMKLVVHTDSGAAIGITARKGLGKLRHINVRYLWLQEKVRSKELNVLKVALCHSPPLFPPHLPTPRFPQPAHKLSLETSLSLALF